MNTSDLFISLRHFSQYDTSIEAEALKSLQGDGKDLLLYLDTKFQNSLTVKGFPSINVPLHQTINYFPPCRHTSDADQEENHFVAMPITDVEAPKCSEFLMSASSEDGSVCIWNSRLQLFMVGRLNFK